MRTRPRAYLGWVLLLVAGLGCSPETGTDAPAPNPASSVAATKPIRSEAQAANRGVDFIVTPTVIDVGAIGHRVSRTLEFTVENRGTKPLRLAEPKASCGCMKVTWSEKALPPGEKRTGTVAVNFGRGMKKFDKYVEFKLPDGTRPQRVRVRAAYHPGVAIEPREVKPMTLIGGQLPESRQVVTIRTEEAYRARATAPLRVENVRAEEVRNAQFRVSQRRVHDHEVELVLEVTPGPTEGRISGALRCDVNGLQLEVPANGHQYHHLVNTPLNFAFPRIDDPRTAEAPIEIYSPAGVDFDITSAEFQSGTRRSPIDFDIEISPRDGGGYRLTARPRPPFPDVTAGVSGKVLVKTTHPERPTIEVRVIGLYKGKK